MGRRGGNVSTSVGTFDAFMWFDDGDADDYVDE